VVTWKIWRSLEAGPQASRPPCEMRALLHSHRKLEISEFVSKWRTKQKDAARFNKESEPYLGPLL